MSDVRVTDGDGTVITVPSGGEPKVCVTTDMVGKAGFIRRFLERARNCMLKDESAMIEEMKGITKIFVVEKLSEMQVRQLLAMVDKLHSTSMWLVLRTCALRFLIEQLWKDDKGPWVIGMLPKESGSEKKVAAADHIDSVVSYSCNVAKCGSITNQSGTKEFIELREKLSAATFEDMLLCFHQMTERGMGNMAKYAAQCAIEKLANGSSALSESLNLSAKGLATDGHSGAHDGMMHYLRDKHSTSHPVESRPPRSISTEYCGRPRYKSRKRRKFRRGSSKTGEGLHRKLLSTEGKFGPCPDTDELMQLTELARKSHKKIMRALATGSIESEDLREKTPGKLEKRSRVRSQAVSAPRNAKIDSVMEHHLQILAGGSSGNGDTVVKLHEKILGMLRSPQTDGLVETSSGLKMGGEDSPGSQGVSERPLATGSGNGDTVLKLHEKILGMLRSPQTDGLVETSSGLKMGGEDSPEALGVSDSQAIEEIDSQHNLIMGILGSRASSGAHPAQDTGEMHVGQPEDGPGVPVPTVEERLTRFAGMRVDQANFGDLVCNDKILVLSEVKN